MRRYAVRLTEHALSDLEDIADYIAAHDSPAKAEHVAGQIEAAFSRLAIFSNRGAHARELAELGNRRFREVYFKPYRIIYLVRDREVVVMLIADGRRDMRALLARRLIED